MTQAALVDCSQIFVFETRGDYVVDFPICPLIAPVVAGTVV